MTTIGQVIESAANKYGVPVNLALAVAWHESSLNPDAVGDDGTSFGLYQLHKNGELGNLSVGQADDPLTNADVALAEFKVVKDAEPTIEGGAWAAAAQRPSEPGAYATKIDVILRAVTDNQMPDSYGRALNAETSVTIPTVAVTPPVVEPTPVVEPAPVEPPKPPEITAVESAVEAQAKVVDAEAVAGKAKALRQTVAELEVHLSELEDLVK